MDISIVITTRNRLKDLRACISSVILSDLKGIDWELVVVDDASTDDTQRMEMQEFGPIQGSVIHNDRQQMMVKSRNVGARAARGNYVLFIDDDNYVPPDMVKRLLTFAKNNPSYGIVGPSMYYADTQEKYLDYQKISFITGKTSGHIDPGAQEICQSDGVPNAFLIRKEVFEKCGYFDEKLIQTFTEPDFAFMIKAGNYKCGMLKTASIYHKTSKCSNFTLRALGGEFSQKAYCLMRNRTVLVCRYAKTWQKLIYLSVFSWVWPAIYSLLVLRSRRFDIIRLYWRGFFDGMFYVFSSRLRNSIVGTSMGNR